MLAAGGLGPERRGSTQLRVLIMRRGREEEEVMHGNRNSLSLWVLCKLGNNWQQDLLVNRGRVFLPTALLSSLSLLMTSQPPQARLKAPGDLGLCARAQREGLDPKSRSLHWPESRELSIHLLLILAYFLLSLQGCQHRNDQTIKRSQGRGQGSVTDF